MEAYCREQGLFHDADSEEVTYSDTLELDLSTVEPSLAGPRRPQDRVALRDAASDFRSELGELIGEAVQHEPAAARSKQSVAESFPASDPPAPARGQRREHGRPPAPHRGGRAALGVACR